MDRIDITAIAKAKELNLNEIAGCLFPKNRHPRLALNRVIAGESFLDEQQISKFALLAGVEIGALFAAVNWSSKVDGNIQIFSSGDFTAHLDTETWTTKIFHKETLFHEHIMHRKQITLSDYLEMLNSEIVKHTSNEDFKN